ncbi:RNA polymerase I-specific transcription initiation factor RRN3 [Hypoxylon fragiforme]|uniref:RNA polymerase I-specific transcription initiation factor RRN3 n=1 Tax=Hypoxylon fragiforme TaxID=63214 RepID=UPI0020C6727F|nr:RNA polymerase I-specific transcription initiation factor RRN3 [Hypoxylon fragiforme]KAI2614686.1 RNA polymerase I-specific transcription initiation factor RRN3 [Hypoxylon fragiforme]
MLSTMTSATPLSVRAPVKTTTTTLKPILKPSSSILGSRRSSDDAGLDEDDIDSLQNPRKRQKVEFDLNNIEIHEIGARSVEVIKQEIRKALDSHDQGDDEDYDMLKETLSGKQIASYDEDDEDEVDPALPAKRRQELKIYLVSLASFSPRMGRSCDGLVKSVLQCQWLGRDEQFAKIYVQFLAALVSAQGTRLTQVLSSIIERFTDSRPSDWAVPNYPTVDREAAQERLHVGVRYLLQLFPSAKAALEHVLSTKYPFHDEPKRMHLAYVDNLLKLRRYCPELGMDIMDLIISRLVTIDVEMQMDLDDMDDRLAAMVAMALKSSRDNGNQDGEDEDESDAESVASDESEDDEYTRVKKAKENIEKMDTVLDTLFEIYTPSFANPQSDEALEVFEDLLSEFSNTILPTIKSRHTQFLIFHFGQKSERLMDAFCGTCINIAFESQRPLILQQAASAYLASFVARGAHVPGHIVVNVFEVLGSHLDQMRTLYETSCRGPDVRRYAPFYSLMQALIYIFCFRWKDLIRSVPDEVDPDDLSSYLDQEIEWEVEIKDIMRRNIYSKLNPLKICAPEIVEEFAMLAHRFRFMYVYPLLESNKRLRLSQFSAGAYSTGGALRDLSFDMNDESWQQLGSFFPFDPYQLPVSKRWVEQDYIHWQHIPGLKPDEGEDESEDERPGEEEEEEEGVEEDTATDDEAEEVK